MTDFNQKQSSLPAMGERRRLLAAGLAGAAASALPSAQAQAPASAKKPGAGPTILILGSGAAGISLANRLSRRLPKATIRIVDRKERHDYWPGLTLVATGVWPKDKVISQNADYLPSSVDWVHEMVQTIDPVAKTVTTDRGQVLPYDFVVIAMGVEYHYDAIEGFSVDAIGTNGLTSVYHSPDMAEKTWGAIEKYSRDGGQSIFTLPATPIRCAGAPLKMTLLTLDRLKQNGGHAKAKVAFIGGQPGVFSVPVINEFVLKRFAEEGLEVQRETILSRVDIGRRIATFKAKDGTETERGYDLLHVVPPMRAPEPVRNSPLAWTSGPFAAGGWLDVDPETLQSNGFPEVFGCGDVNGTPFGKTAATVKMSLPVVEANLIAAIEGKDPVAKFNGYTSCPLITKIGSAMLVEFNYKRELIPTYSFIDPTQESWFAWVMKEQLLRPAYLQMLRGAV